MSDVFEHNPGDHEDPLAGPTWTLGIIGIAMLAVSVLGVAAIFYDRSRVEDDVKVLAKPTVQLEDLRNQQLARLGGEVRIEKRSADEESLVIPLEQAMTLVVEDAQRR